MLATVGIAIVAIAMPMLQSGDKPDLKFHNGSPGTDHTCLRVQKVLEDYQNHDCHSSNKVKGRRQLRSL